MAEQKGRGGHNKQTILLTPDTFKDLCMMAGTPEGKEARRYFRAMEDVVKEYTLMQQAFKDQQLLETRAQLEEQTRVHQNELQAKDNELQMYKSKKYEEREHIGFCYVIQTDGGIKVGKTKDIGKRVKGLQTANTNDLRILLAFPTSNPDLVERSAITRDELVSKLGETLCIKGIPPPPPPVLVSDPFNRFLHERTVPVSKEDKEAWIQPTEFYNHFWSWCEEHGYQQKDASIQNCGKSFRGMGLPIEKRCKGGLSTQWVVGLKLT
ncbi:hypothetical protein HK102_005093 [Quaeritorhiza haematococci]|nr:hypothetical protein HK102_005093 [Quaeritorhiza haematococci]